MTATPIPRTLGQVLYADLDVSDLRTPPAGRVQIRTGIRRPNELEGTWRKVREEAALGHSTFVVVPLIEEGADESEGAVAAETEAVRLSALLDPLRVGMVHGRMKPAERDAEMTRFRDGELDVLVGTTVVEVGVDVPAATMMVIQGADRFGLAQLHQLRGRVGRGSRPSPRRMTDSPSPRRTSSCARRATSWDSPRAGSRGCASRRSKRPPTGTWPFGRGRTRRCCWTRRAGWIHPDRSSPRSWNAAGSAISWPRNRPAAHDRPCLTPAA
jgi:hypothetical protein